MMHAVRIIQKNTSGRGMEAKTYLGGLAIKFCGRVLHLVDVGLQVLELTLHLSQLSSSITRNTQISDLIK